jgi:ureidoacrylate peracid hydrolase
VSEIELVGTTVPQHLPKTSRSLSLPARPEEFPIDPEQAALIVVDMQNAYLSKGGYFDICGFDITGADLVIARVKQVLQAARSLGMQIIFFQNGWDSEKTEAGGPGSPNWWKSNALKAMRARPEIDGMLITKGTWDYDLVEGLEPRPNEIVIQKPRYSGFCGTQLDAVLRARNVKQLVLVGTATNVCIESTARDGFFLEYFPVVIEDACIQAGPPALQAATIFNIESFFGWVTRSSQFCALTNA